ncbi:MAG TPA: CoA pyrophosphatase [Gammaproteobacteria bacterium]|nr:CoA pyrophosphatase [Gammaproteobacteria bacterium]
MESKVKTLDVIRRRLAAPRAPRDPRARLLGNIEGPVSPTLREILDRPGRPASVLLALFERPAGPTVLFTERAAHLKDHAGQVSLPGGRLAAGETAAEAALREAHEEVGLEPSTVDVIGSLDDFLTGTGFTITPVVGIVSNSTFTAIPDPREVAGVFEVPLTVILDRTAMSVGYFERHGSRLLTYELMYVGRRIWGATAAVLRNFQDVILDEDGT